MKRHRLRLLMASAAASLALSACGGEEPAAPPAAAAPAATAKAGSKGSKAPIKQNVDDDAGPVLAVPANYRGYEPRGRRDPFVNPIPTPKPPAEPEPLPARPQGLRGVLVAEARISGIVASREPGMTRVLIMAPGKKTYFAGRGDSLFDGIIKEIRPDAVVFTMISPVTKQPVNREETVRAGESAGTSAGEKK